MLKLGRVTEVKVFFLLLVYVFDFSQFNLFEFSGRYFGEGSIDSYQWNVGCYWNCLVVVND